jgi:hypothetical protein
MLRTTAKVRPFLKNFSKINSTRSSFNAASSTNKLGRDSHLHSLSSKRPQAIHTHPLRPATISVLRFATGPSKENPLDKIDKKAEEKLAGQTLEAHPDLVDGGSSVRHVFEASQSAKERGDGESDMLAGIKQDLVS